MSLNNTPSANRLHVALFGRRNSGKSSLINALTGQDTALVSDIPGTTTDTVSKAMEIQGIGPCLFIDTPGFDDEGELGEMRIIRTLKAIEQTDIALLLCEDEAHEEEKKWMKQLEEKNIPVILLLNKADIRKDIASTLLRIEKDCGQKPLVISAKERTGIKKIHQAILEKLPADFGQQTITGNLVKEGDLVLLVMPQDIQAPKGRLILPQVQTMRELLDKKCLVMSCTTDQIASTLQALSRPPKLIITDSQVFHTVYEQKPADSLLTSFSVLMAGYKGDIHYYIEDLPHFIVPWHYHPAIEIMYITRGIGTRFVGDCIEQYEEGDVCMIGPNLPHEWRNDDAYFDKESGLRATCICLFFKREIFDPNFIRLPEMNNIRDLIERSRRGLKFTGNSKLEITRFIRSSVNDVGVRKVTNLLTLLELMATSTEYELLASVGFTNSVNSEDFERFNKVYKFLVKNFATSIRLEEVSTLVGLTPTAFCRYFKERTKKTFVEYLNEMRIGYSKKLLLENKMKISTISGEVGFPNLSNFISQFKKVTGMSPSQFQKQFGVKAKQAI